MAIQKINLGTEPLGEGGDTYRSANTKINDNFSNSTHAASRLVGNAVGNLVEMTVEGVGGYGLGGLKLIRPDIKLQDQHVIGLGAAQISSGKVPEDAPNAQIGKILYLGNSTWGSQMWFSYDASKVYFRNKPTTSDYESWKEFYHTGNTTKDSNGFLKGKSPVTRLYNYGLEHQGDDKELYQISFEKLGVGDYLLKNTTGLANKGWYIETPKDANGNVLVAVVYEQLENNDISIKTYDYMLNKKGRIVPDTDTPLDIPDTRWIDLRFNEIEQEEPNELSPETED